MFAAVVVVEGIAVVSKVVVALVMVVIVVMVVLVVGLVVVVVVAATCAYSGRECCGGDLGSAGTSATGCPCGSVS